MTILLHTCCAPCACYPIEYLLGQGYKPALFFYNPNIHPKHEYGARLYELERYLNSRWSPPAFVREDPARNKYSQNKSDKPEQIRLIKGDYEDKRWFKLTGGLEQEPERGRRCDVCYQIRLKKTAETARKQGFNYFGSTLSISPHKNAVRISQIGNELEAELGVKFYDKDWKKQDGFKRACDISREYGFYRQDYCGCIWSLKHRND